MKDSLKSTKTTVLCCIIIGILLIGLAVFITLSDGGWSFLKPAKPTPTAGVQPTPTDSAIKTEGDMTEQVLIISVNTEEKTLRVHEPLSDEIRTLQYAGSTDIRNRFGSTIAATQISNGSIAEISYDSKSGQAYRITLTDGEWFLEKASGLKINLDKGMLSIGETNYRCSTGTVVLSEGETYPISKLSELDVVNLRGIGDRVYLIELLRGHGTLYLMNEADFIDGDLYIDYTFSSRITPGMAVVLPEGSYQISISKEELQGEGTINISKDGTTIFDAITFLPVETEQGSVAFLIEPEGADLYVDSRQRNPENKVVLPYGEHVVEVFMTGMTSWQGKITVCSPEMDIVINLVEKPIATPTPIPTSSPEPTEVPGNPDGSEEDGDREDNPDGSQEDGDGEDNPDGSQEDGGSEDNPDGSEEDGDSEYNPDDEEPEPTGVPQDGSIEVQIFWHPTSIVRVDSEYAGMTDASGLLRLDMSYGTHVISLTRMVIDGQTQPVTYTVEIDNTTVLLRFPTG